MTSRVRVPLAAAGFIILAASAFLVIRVGARATTSITLAGIRFYAAAAGFAVLALARRGWIRLDFEKRDLPLFLLTGATGGVLYSVALFIGQATASAGTASLIGATIPIWASVIAVTIGRERLPGIAWLGVLLAFSGTLIMTVDPSSVDGLDTGAAMILVAALSNAVYFVSVKRLVIRYGALSAVAGTVWAGSMLFLPFVFWMEPVSTWSFPAVGSGLFLGLCATLAGATLFAYVIGKVGAARASMVAYLVAPMVIVFEWLIFDAPPGSDLLTGGALTLTGLFLVRPRYKRESEMAYSSYKTSTHDVKIRTAVPADIPALIRLTRELAKYQDLGDRYAATEAGIRAGLFGRHRSAEAIVAETGNAIVGYAIYARSFSSTRCATKIIVEDAFVAPDSRGKGVGHALFKAIGRRAKELDACYAEWTVLRDNQAALEFYDRLGAEPSPEWVTCKIERPVIDNLVRTSDDQSLPVHGSAARTTPRPEINKHPAECV